MSSAIVVVGDSLDVMPIEAAILRANGGFYARVPDLAAASWLLATQGHGAIVVIPKNILPMRAEQRRWRERHGAAALLSTRDTRTIFFRIKLALALRAHANRRSANNALESWT